MKTESKMLGILALLIVVATTGFWIYNEEKRASDLDNEIEEIMRKYGEADSDNKVSGSDNEATTIGPELEIIDWNWRTEHGFAITEGQVKNISNQRLENVQAVVTFLTEDGTFIKSDNALIEYNPIMPDQVSPFRVTSSENPMMQTARIEFKKLFGGTIRTKNPD